MGHHHHHHAHHDHAHHHSMKNITLAFWLNTGFALIELMGGLYTNSVAILADALHDFGDSLALGLSYFFQKKSAQKRDAEFSYGYKRFSLLGAFINSLVLIVGSVFILQEVVSRLFSPEVADAKGMIWFALAGVVVNGVAMLRLRKGTSLNERVISLHFLEDVLGWVAVLIGSLLMLFFDLPYLDPVLSLLITLFILFNVFKNLRSALKIILQGVPENVDVKEIRQKILSLKGVKGIHDLHVWTMDGEYNVLTLHVVISDHLNSDIEKLKTEIRHALEHSNIAHTTIEIEAPGQVCALNELETSK